MKKVLGLAMALTIAPPLLSQDMPREEYIQMVGGDNFFRKKIEALGFHDVKSVPDSTWSILMQEFQNSANEKFENDAVIFTQKAQSVNTLAIPPLFHSAESKEINWAETNTLSHLFQHFGYKLRVGVNFIVAHWDRFEAVFGKPKIEKMKEYFEHYNGNIVNNKFIGTEGLSESELNRLQTILKNNNTLSIEDEALMRTAWVLCSRLNKNSLQIVDAKFKESFDATQTPSMHINAGFNAFTYVDQQGNVRILSSNLSDTESSIYTTALTQEKRNEMRALWEYNSKLLREQQHLMQLAEDSRQIPVNLIQTTNTQTSLSQNTPQSLPTTPDITANQSEIIAPERQEEKNTPKKNPVKIQAYAIKPKSKSLTDNDENQEDNEEDPNKSIDFMVNAVPPERRSTENKNFI